MAQASYTIGRLTLHPGRQLLGGDATPVAIGARALAILTLLAERSGDVVKKDEILATVWNGAIVEDNALQAQISAVRRALGIEASRLSTVHAFGYRLTLDRHDSDSARETADPASVAIMAFDNLTGDPGNDYLADGLAEELIARLSRVPGLKIPARTSSFAYRGKAMDIRTIARELGVSTVLEGSVRGASTGLRATAQLVDAVSGFHIWSQTFDHTMTDLLALQDDLASAIANALRRELSANEHMTANSEAMRLVLQARAMSRKQTQDSLEAAILSARQALAIDPSFGKAWESLAGARLVQVNMGHADISALAEVRAFAQKAIALDPDMGGALGILAAIDAVGGRLNDAMDRLLEALAADPVNPVLGDSIALYALLPAGRVAQTASYLDRSIALGPARPQPHMLRGLCRTLAGNRADAKAQIETALLLGQNRASSLLQIILAHIGLAEGRLAEARSALSELMRQKLALDDSDELLEKFLRTKRDHTGRAVASEALAELFAIVDDNGSVWKLTATVGVFALCHAVFGELDAAFDVADRMVERWRQTKSLSINSLILFWLPAMAQFRADSRFSGLVEAFGLFEFWERHGPPDGYTIDNGLLKLLGTN